jgi:hypothetical protein
MILVKAESSVELTGRVMWMPAGYGASVVAVLHDNTRFAENYALQKMNLLS